MRRRTIVSCVVILGLGVLPRALPLADASVTACPNEVLRLELHSGQLPDCRAYELVTPAYKEGTYISAVLAISQDGSHLVGSSLGAFSGVEGDGLGNGTSFLGASYELTRTTGPAGWRASPLDPPRSIFESNGLFDASADLNTTLWELGRHPIAAPGAPPEEQHCPAREGTEDLQPEGLTDFYREEPLGTFAEVGPATPEPCFSNRNKYAYIGGSSNLSHIVFSAGAGFRWPFDETAGEASTLYEYVGTGNTRPSLVGASDSGSLVSDCGIRLGSSPPSEASGSFGSMYNAISASGGRIFFTAVGEDDQACGAAQPTVDELFVREETPSPGAPPEVRLSPISCREGLPSPCADANFEGASQDGSKVFFTSTQALLAGASEDGTGDSAVGVGPSSNETKGCIRTEGAGGCNLYEDELSGSGPALVQRLVLVSGGSADPRVQGVARISEDGSHIYFVAKGVLTGSNSEGRTPTAGDDNLYVFEDDERTGQEGFQEGRTSFIATLSPNDENADWRRADERAVQASQDGSLLVFESQEDLTDEGVTHGVEQVYQYDAQTGFLARGSIGEEGYADDNKSPESDATITVRPSGYVYDHNDSPTQANGVLAPQNGAVFFESPDALTPQALHDGTNTLGQLVPNIYEYRAGHVYLISDGHDESTLHGGPGVNLLGSDLSGEDAFLETSDSLIAQDTDTQQDVYDARIGGGISVASASQACEGEGCRDALGQTPGLLTPASATQPAESNSPPILSPTKLKAKVKITKKVRRKHRRAKRASRRVHVGVRPRSLRR